jgi:transcription elongation factor Elf1
MENAKVTQTQFHCPNCQRWSAIEITRQVAHHERRAFRCTFCGHSFLENQSVDEYNEAAAREADLEAADDAPFSRDESGWPRCDLCGTTILPFDMHGYGECVEMPDNFMSIYFDELRHRGVALARSWGEDRQRFESHREPVPQYPRDFKFRVMMTKANALANAYYVAKREALAAVIGDRNYWYVDDRILAKLEVPSYEMMRNMLLDGDFVDDGDPTGGDYVLACRVALQITAARYRPV